MKIQSISGMSGDLTFERDGRRGINRIRFALTTIVPCVGRSNGMGWEATNKARHEKIGKQGQWPATHVKEQTKNFLKPFHIPVLTALLLCIN